MNDKTVPLIDLAEKIRAKLPTIRARTGNPLFDAGTCSACDTIEELVNAQQSADQVGGGGECTGCDELQRSLRQKRADLIEYSQHIARLGEEIQDLEAKGGHASPSPNAAAGHLCAYVYEWEHDGIVRRSFDSSPYNGMPPTRTVAYYRAMTSARLESTDARELVRRMLRDGQARFGAVADFSIEADRAIWHDYNVAMIATEEPETEVDTTTCGAIVLARNAETNEPVMTLVPTAAQAHVDP